MSNDVNDHQTVARDGYEVTFHPAFAARCAVQPTGGEELELYRQEGVYNLPKGQEKPPTRHQLRFRSKRHGQDVSFTIDDPHHRIAQIVVHLYGEGHEPGRGEEDETVETVTIDNSPVLCPPNC